MADYIRNGNICGAKTQYPDGIGYCIWQPFPDDESSGLCWDFPAADFDTLLALLIDLRDGPVHVIITSDETEAVDEQLPLFDHA